MPYAVNNSIFHSIIQAVFNKLPTDLLDFKSFIKTDRKKGEKWIKI